MAEDTEATTLEIPGIGILKIDSIFSTTDYDSLCVVSIEGDKIIAYDLDYDEDDDDEEINLEIQKSEVISILPEVQDRDYDRLR